MGIAAKGMGKNCCAGRFASGGSEFSWIWLSIGKKMRKLAKS